MFTWLQLFFVYTFWYRKAYICFLFWEYITVFWYRSRKHTRSIWNTGISVPTKLLTHVLQISNKIIQSKCLYWYKRSDPFENDSVFDHAQLLSYRSTFCFISEPIYWFVFPNFRIKEPVLGASASCMLLIWQKATEDTGHLGDSEQGKN